MQKTCIVIPCYNEGNRLNCTEFLTYSAAHANVYFLFVNDGSTDSTPELLSSLVKKNNEQFCFINRSKNLGKAESVREGILKGLAWKPFAFIGYLDADLATPLTEIKWLLEPLERNPKAIMAFGNRRKTHTNTIYRNAWRHNFGRLYAGFITTLLSLDVYDTQCGAKIFRTKAANTLFQAPFIDRWLFDVEIFCRIKKIKNEEYEIIEVALREWKEQGDSRIRKRDILRLPLRTLKIFFRYL